MACPALVILDINLPKKHGGQVLQQMRAIAPLRQRAGSGGDLVGFRASDRETMAKLGANGYFRKPSDYERLHEARRTGEGFTGPGPAGAFLISEGLESGPYGTGL